MAEATEDFAGLTLEALEELSDTLITRLTQNLEDGDCLSDAYVLSRATLDLAVAYRHCRQDNEMLRARIELMRSGRRS